MQLPVASWGGGGEWSKQLGLGKLQGWLPARAPPEEAGHVSGAHVTVSVQPPGRKDQFSVAGPPQTVCCSVTLPNGMHNAVHVAAML